MTYLLIRYSLFILIAMTASSCASRKDFVDQVMILPANSSYVEVEKNQRFIMAVPINSPTPAFPLDGHSGLNDATICSRFVVTEDGRVRDIEQIDDAPNCMALSRMGGDVFMGQVRKALEQWTYFGAAICEFEASEDECRDGHGSLRPLSIRLAYRSNFSTKNGRRAVAFAKES